MRELLIICVFLFLNNALLFVLEGGLQFGLGSRMLVMIISMFGMLLPKLIQRINRYRQELQETNDNNNNNNSDNGLKQSRIDNYFKYKK